MFNSNILALALEEYRRDFHVPSPEKNNQSNWEAEQYKWIAVKHFQDNWDIDAEDFGVMFTAATSKTYNLLNSRNFFPLGMILEFIKVDVETVRTMFRNLFDENVSIVDRVNSFIDNSENLRVKYGRDKWQSHFQNMNSVSTYLWLRYPDKYYIYKYSECRQVADVLESDFTVKKVPKQRYYRIL